MEFSRQEFWSGLPFPPPEDLPNPGIKSGSLALQADSLLSEPPEVPTKAEGLNKLPWNPAPNAREVTQGGRVATLETACLRESTDMEEISVKADS